MTMTNDVSLTGTQGRIAVRHWGTDRPRMLVLLVHGYGEHSGRYPHVAERLVAEGAVVYAPDHLGHGRSEGERVLIHDVDDMVRDLHALRDRAVEENPGLPLVLVGHSMGGIIATRYAQQYPDELTALVLSGPVIGGNPLFKQFLELPEIPEIPIDPAMLSRDPAVGEAYAEDPLVWHGAFKRPTLEALFAAVDRIAEGPSLGELPVLWLHGEEDPLAPLDVSAEAVERSAGQRVEKHVYPGARHEVFNETNAADVLADLARFLDRHIPRSAS